MLRRLLDLFASSPRSRRATPRALDLERLGDRLVPAVVTLSNGNLFVAADNMGEEITAQVDTKGTSNVHDDQLKLHCVRADTSLMDFVVDALREKLTRESGRRRRSAS